MNRSVIFEVQYSSGGRYLPTTFLISGRCAIKELAINEEIREKEVRLIDENGEQLGIVNIDEANEKAADAHLDLVMISPNATPVVCKIMDYGKYRYEMIKRLKDQKKNQKTIEVKEIRFSPSIDDHDLEVKAKKAKEILEEGNKVKVCVRFRGRELGHTELGKDVLDQFAALILEVGSVEKKPKMEGRSMVMFLEPKSDKQRRDYGK